MENYYYNAIAHDYHLKRKKPWKQLESFITDLEKKGYLFKGNCLDLGCANGRHFELFKNSNNKLIGIDNSLNFLKIALDNLRDSVKHSKNKLCNIQVILGDLNYIPLRAKTIQSIFLIASIHHIKSKIKREEGVKQLFELMKNGGKILITVWRRWQKKFRKYFIYNWFKRMFNKIQKKPQENKGLEEFGDKYIPWTVSQKKRTYYRFYHFFSKKEIKKLIKDFEIKVFHRLGGPTNRDNFFILAQKKEIFSLLE